MKIARRARIHAAQSALFAILAQVQRKAKYARTPVVGQFGVAPRYIGAFWGCAGPAARDRRYKTKLHHFPHSGSGAIECRGGGTCPDLIGKPPIGYPTWLDRRYSFRNEAVGCRLRASRDSKLGTLG